MKPIPELGCHHRVHRDTGEKLNISFHCVYRDTGGGLNPSLHRVHRDTGEELNHGRLGHEER